MMKLGMIGMSAGNAHPYSWSSIINNKFDGEEISRIGYPAVAAYLRANSDTLGINSARVTHVWAQEKSIAESIAASGGIDHVVANMEDMIGHVDAVILGRDDPENHRAMAKPFLDANVPIFIDKPLAISYEDLDYFASEHQKGKFFMSCSSVRYAVEIRVVKQAIDSFGPIELITAVAKKDWIKYGVHTLEGIFSLLNDPKPISVKHIGEENKDIVLLVFEGGLQVLINLFMDIVPTSQISVFGQKNWQLIEIKNSYALFRDNIIEFIRSVEEGAPRVEFSKTEAIIRTLIAANESLKKGGETIYLNK